MSNTKSISHTIICDHLSLYVYRGNLLFYNDLEKIKVLKKNYISIYSSNRKNTVICRFRSFVFSLLNNLWWRVGSSWEKILMILCFSILNELAFYGFMAVVDSDKVEPESKVSDLKVFKHERNYTFCYPLLWRFCQ